MTRRLRDEVQFQRLDTTPDDYGNVTGNAFTTFLTVFGNLTPQRGRERMNNMDLRSEVGAVLTVRSGADTRAVTEENIAIVRGNSYQIRSITNPDQRDKYLEMVLERGVAL